MLSFTFLVVTHTANFKSCSFTVSAGGSLLYFEWIFFCAEIYFKCYIRSINFLPVSDNYITGLLYHIISYLLSSLRLSSATWDLKQNLMWVRHLIKNEILQIMVLSSIDVFIYCGHLPIIIYVGLSKVGEKQCMGEKCMNLMQEVVERCSRKKMHECWCSSRRTIKSIF